MKIDEKYFESNGMRTNSVEDVLMEGESVLWRSKPQKKAYLLSAVLRMLPLAIVWAAVDTGFIVMLSLTGWEDLPKGLIAMICVFFALHLAPVWIWIWNIIKACAEIKNIEYAFTEKRIIIRTGVIVDFKFVFYDKIQSVNVKVGVWDRLCHVGDIYITTPTDKAVIFDQADPYQLAAKLQKISQDILTDINYPNALRPEANPGYDTTYTKSPFADSFASSAYAAPAAGEGSDPMTGLQEDGKSGEQ